MDSKSLASLEVLFWLKPKGIKEKDLLSFLSLKEKGTLKKILEEAQSFWQKEESKGFILKNEGSLWFLEPKESYLFWLERLGKEKRIPLDQREIIALLFYEKGLSLERIEEKRGNRNSRLILSRLLKEELVESREGVFFLSEKCKSLFLDQENKKRMDE